MSEIGAIKDRENSKFVTSPSRGIPQAAVEVLVGNQSNTPVPIVTKGTPRAVFNEVNALGLQTVTVIDFTLGAGLGSDLVGVVCSGQNKARYTVEVNGSPLQRKSTYYTQFNLDFDLGAYPIVDGDNVKVIAENKSNSAAEFNATLKHREYEL
jgi:hypothetical protein